MIAHVRGTVSGVGATWAVVDLGGFGIRVLCTPATAAGLRVGEECDLATSLVVREDSLTLFGFAQPAERDAFELVQSASGIGPKIAQAVVSVLTPGELQAAISSGNVAALIKVPGIGRKGAERLIIELRDKVAGLADVDQATPSPSRANEWEAQVTAGLESLGWSTRDAHAAAERVAPLVEDNPAISVAELMRAALRSLAK